MPLRPAASSFAESPSTKKLIERLRWLPTERPTPGTADVSAKSCVLLMLGVATPGARSAMSRNCRPLSGSALISRSDTVAAIWLRADSSTGVSAVTLTVEATPATSRVSGKSNAAPSVRVRRRRASAKPVIDAEISYGPTRR